MPDVRVLSFHAAYRCRHAGACCTSNWPIPVEADRLDPLRTGLATGTVRPALAGTAPVIAIDSNDPTDPPALIGRAHGHCVFFDADESAAGGRCRIHAGLGHDALPLACRQFPRVSVLDPRGTSVTLSHYCVTAAALLDTPGDASPAEPVVNADRFPARAEYSGLDARGTLPPLLRPGMLMDWESWWECERLAVEVLTQSESAADGLARLRAVVNSLDAWFPQDGPLIAHVRAAFRSVRRSPARVPGAVLVAAVYRAIPAGLSSPAALAEPRMSENALRRFLAAHAFASWAIHLRGLQTWLLSIEAAGALIESGLGPRAADLLLRHLADTPTLCDELAKVGS